MKTIHKEITLPHIRQPFCRSLFKKLFGNLHHQNIRNMNLSFHRQVFLLDVNFVPRPLIPTHHIIQAYMKTIHKEITLPHIRQPFCRSLFKKLFGNLHHQNIRNMNLSFHRQVFLLDVNFVPRLLIPTHHIIHKSVACQL